MLEIVRSMVVARLILTTLPLTLDGLFAATIEETSHLCVEHGREWQNWGHHAGIDIHQFKVESHLSDSNLMLTAAMAGQGIAVARHSLVEAEIAAGNLVRLFDIVAPSDYSYYLVTPAGAPKSEDLLAFAEWLKKEARRFAKTRVK